MNKEKQKEKQLNEETINEIEDQPKTCTTVTDCGTAPQGFYYECQNNKCVLLPMP